MLTKSGEYFMPVMFLSLDGNAPVHHPKIQLF